MIRTGAGSQTVEGNGGNDRFLSFGDAGEPDPAQTEGPIGRVNPPVVSGSANDTLKGGTGGDRFEFRALLNAKQEILDEYTREDGTINWRGPFLKIPNIQIRRAINHIQRFPIRIQA